LLLLGVWFITTIAQAQVRSDKLTAHERSQVIWQGSRIRHEATAVVAGRLSLHLLPRISPSWPAFTDIDLPAWILALSILEVHLLNNRSEHRDDPALAMRERRV
jgi:hypothetical protein